MKKLKMFLLAGVLIFTLGSPSIVKASEIINYGANVNNGGLYKYAMAYTETDGAGARARVVLGKEESDKVAYGYVQTLQVAEYYTTTAYIAHGSDAKLSIYYSS